MQYQPTNNTLIMKKILIFISLLFFMVALPIFAQAITFRPSTTGLFNVSAGKSMNINGATLGNMIVRIYDWSIKAIALLSVVMIMVGGFQWILAAGSAPQISAAKDRIFSALIGLALVLSAYLILDFINPQLVSFENLSPTKIEKENNLLPNDCNFDAGERTLDSSTEFEAKEECSNSCLGGNLGKYTLRHSDNNYWCCKCNLCSKGEKVVGSEEDCESYCTSIGKEVDSCTSTGVPAASQRCCKCKFPDWENLSH